MLRGFATISFYADDLDAARAWYAEVLGIDAYFQIPGYTEFRVGEDEDELGIIDRRFAPSGEPAEPGGSITFWHVDDVTAAHRRLLDLGARDFQPPIERGEGFITAVVVDPFGNLLGVMENPHWAERHATS